MTADEKPDALLEEIKRLDREMNEDRESKDDSDGDLELDQLIKDGSEDRDEQAEDEDEKRATRAADDNVESKTDVGDHGKHSSCVRRGS